MVLDDIKSSMEIQCVLSLSEKRQEVYKLAKEKGIVLDESTQEFFDYYLFRKKTVIQYDEDEIMILSVEGNWEDEVHIKHDGTYSCFGGINCIF